MSQQFTSVPDPSVPELASTKHAQRRLDARRFNLSSLGAMTFLVVCAIYFLVPFLWLIVAATKTGPDVSATFEIGTLWDQRDPACSWTGGPQSPHSVS